jgi:type II secretory pathway pseudopilin PulG
MVAVSIISVLTAIAVPNLLRSRIVANETAAIASLRALAAAQHTFRRSDYDGDGALEFAYYSELSQVWRPDAGGMWSPERINLIDRSLANAHRWGSPLLPMGPTIPKAGYYFHEVFGYRDINNHWPDVGKDTGTAWVVLRYGFSATPAAYDGTGVNIFETDDKGVIWQKDGALDSTYQADDHVWFLRVEQAMRADHWLIVE